MQHAQYTRAHAHDTCRRCPCRCSYWARPRYSPTCPSSSRSSSCSGRGGRAAAEGGEGRKPRAGCAGTSCRGLALCKHRSAARSSLHPGTWPLELCLLGQHYFGVVFLFFVHLLFAFGAKLHMPPAPQGPGFPNRCAKVKKAARVKQVTQHRADCTAQTSLRGAVSDRQYLKKVYTVHVLFTRFSSFSCPFVSSLARGVRHKAAGT